MDIDQIFEKSPRKLSGLRKRSLLARCFSFLDFFSNRPLMSLEPEEVFLDAQMDQSHKMEVPVNRRKFFFFYALAIVLFVILMGTAGWLQIIKGSAYLSQAEKTPDLLHNSGPYCQNYRAHLLFAVHSNP